MTARYPDRATRNHSRQRGIFSDAFDRFMDNRERPAARHGKAPALTYGCGFDKIFEIERRSLLDTFAPVRS